jgi:hypothetical protein
MSSIPKILDILEAEVNRHLEHSPHELKEFIRSLDTLDLSRLLKNINQRLRTKILELIHPRSVRKAIKMMDVHMEAECLNNIGEKQRLRVVEPFSRKRRAEALIRLKRWQSLEEFNWKRKILPLLVMTGEIPAHYPPEMSACVVCGDGYEIWHNIIAADCQAHSFHEECEAEEGICPREGCSR